jgi:hypothetical protein
MPLSDYLLNLHMLHSVVMHGNNFATSCCPYYEGRGGMGALSNPQKSEDAQ